MLLETAKYYPVVSVVGPRQSGKTTLLCATFPRHRYVSLEELDVQNSARQDPRGFLTDYLSGEGVIFDEVQHVPELLSYIQVYVDKHNIAGRIIISGSQNLLLNQAVSQSLAGRVGILTLLPLSVEELASLGGDYELDSFLFNGCYPRIYNQHIPAQSWYLNYLQTYIERDVRQISHVANLSSFKRFMQLCAGRIGQLLNVESLSNDADIPVQTVREWLSILEACYIIFLLQPYHKNFSKRLIKAPKIYFYDTGIACSLLGIQTIEQLKTHYLRGGLFESCMLSNIQKYFYNQGLQPRCYFWRDAETEREVDCLVEHNTKLYSYEIKSSQTMNMSFFDNLTYWQQLSNCPPEQSAVIYAGREEYSRSHGRVCTWKNAMKLLTL